MWRNSYNDFTMSESRFQALATKIAAQYRKKGFSASEAAQIGRGTAAVIGRRKYGPKSFAGMAVAGRRKNPSIGDHVRTMDLTSQEISKVGDAYVDGYGNGIEIGNFNIDNPGITYEKYRRWCDDGLNELLESRERYPETKGLWGELDSLAYKAFYSGFKDGIKKVAADHGLSKKTSLRQRVSRFFTRPNPRKQDEFAPSPREIAVKVKEYRGGHNAPGYLIEATAVTSVKHPEGAKAGDKVGGGSAKTIAGAKRVAMAEVRHFLLNVDSKKVFVDLPDGSRTLYIVVDGKIKKRVLW